MNIAEWNSRQLKWDLRLLSLARFIASWSKDPSTKVGAVIADQKHRLISAGFNGLPSGVHDTLDRLEIREIKYEMTLHAEENALLFSRQDLTGCSVYVWPLPPCSRCAGKLIQSGLSRVVTCSPSDELLERWSASNALAFSMFQEAGIQLVELELPNEQQDVQEAAARRRDADRWTASSEV